MKNGNIITLDKANLNTVYYIDDIKGLDKKQLYRLYDFGLVKGSKITPIFRSMFNGTVAYQVKGSVLALRIEDTKNITVNTRR